ncbi:MAG: helix-turn-helix domain-containing protein [Candidatus Moraniibacteriota bacterium]
MYTQQLLNAGLSQIQAETLNFLLGNGQAKAIDIVKGTALARGVVYKALEELLALKLVEKIEQGGQVARFRAEHPSKLEEFFEEREKKVKKEKRDFLENLPEIVSAYNLASNKPGVKFLEGEAGIQVALFDTLKSNTEIYTFADVKSTNENIKEINDAYVKKREQLKVKKKIIVSDSEDNRKFFENFNSEITQVKFIKQQYYPFKTDMQIYANKVSYQTMEKGNQIAIIIEDKNIYQMHKLFFEYMWETL